MNARLRGAREERGWSQSQLIGALERAAIRHERRLPDRVTTKSLISRWENGRAKPDPWYRQLLREALGKDDTELGFEKPNDDVVPAADELRAQLNLQPGAIDLLAVSLRQQTESIRLQDRQYGAPTLLEQTRCHVTNIERHLTHSVFEDDRRALARLLADAAALAGWQAHDLLALEQAWRFFECSTGAARLAEDLPLWVFAQIEQAQVLSELGSPLEAAIVAENAYERVLADVAPAVQCWTAAGTSELLALAGRESDSRAMMSIADSLSASLLEPLPPYLVFGPLHLERWMGHILVILHDDEALPLLERADAGYDLTFARAGASLNLDLAIAHTRRGDTERARSHKQLAEQYALRVGSRRFLMRIRSLNAAS